MPIHSRRTISDFLSQKRIAFVGVGRDPRDFSRSLFTELANRGYDLVPVNPHATEIAGRKCFSKVGDVSPGVDAALLMTKPENSAGLVDECAAAGIKKVWLYRGAGQGAVTPAAVERCNALGIDVIAGECPFMFLPDTQWFHGFHGVLRKITGTYPKA